MAINPGSIEPTLTTEQVLAIPWNTGSGMISVSYVSNDGKSNVVKIASSANDLTVPRTQIITIKSDGLTANVSIVQEAKTVTQTGKIYISKNTSLDCAFCYFYSDETDASNCSLDGTTGDWSDMDEDYYLEDFTEQILNSKSTTDGLKFCAESYDGEEDPDTYVTYIVTCNGVTYCNSQSACDGSEASCNIKVSALRDLLNQGYDVYLTAGD